MPRAQRLLDLIQVLRRHRHPVSGAALAEATGVSLRTLYRDIETLKADGRPGIASVLRWQVSCRVSAAERSSCVARPGIAPASGCGAD